MYKRLVAILIVAIVASNFVPSVIAQSGGPVYIVQAGDTFYSIANRFNITFDELVAANPTANPDFISEGQQLVIPGLEGISGILDTEIIEFGDSLRSLSRRTQVSDEHLIRLNRLVSPTELYVGISLIIPKQEGQQEIQKRVNINVGESLLELAVKQNSDPWTLVNTNKQQGTWDALPNDTLYSPTGNAEESATGLPSTFLSASISPLPMIQGETETIRVQTKDNIPVSGMLVDRPLNFFQTDSDQVALQGVHALLESGVYPLRVQVTFPDGSIQSFEQMVLVKDGGYSHETLIVPNETIDPTVIEPENETVAAIVNTFTPIKYWNGSFFAPAVYPDAFTSFFGTRRTYKGTGTDLTIQGFHTGLDFGGGNGLQIFAPATGKIVFAAPLTVRGNATIIDHGLGVFSGIWHQSEILVQVGDVVEQGQVIGLVGGTGRVTGAHLHWELWVNGVQVNPLDWLNQVYP
jgi:murein DD-endopeptidase MepM/ murein hydrolase activator NlpD